MQHHPRLSLIAIGSVVVAASLMTCFGGNGNSLPSTGVNTPSVPDAVIDCPRFHETTQRHPTHPDRGTKYENLQHGDDYRDNDGVFFRAISELAVVVVLALAWVFASVIFAKSLLAVCVGCLYFSGNFTNHVSFALIVAGLSQIAVALVDWHGETLDDQFFYDSELKSSYHVSVGSRTWLLQSFRSV